MHSADTIARIKDTVDKAGMGEIISVSDNVNESACIMCYQEEGKPVFLALFDKPKIAFADVKNVLYSYGEDKMYDRPDTILRLVFALNDGATYAIESDGEGMLSETFDYEGKRQDDPAGVDEALEKYNARHEVGRNKEKDAILSVFEVVLEFLGESQREYLNEGTVDAVKRKMEKYTEENPDDVDFLFEYAYDSLRLAVYGEDAFDAEQIVGVIKAQGRLDDFAEYIRRELSDSSGEMYLPEFYAELMTALWCMTDK